VKATPKTIDEILIDLTARTRGIRAETASRYPQLKKAGNPAAIGKRMDRQCEKGVLASSPLPKGPKIYRLSNKGVRLTGSPSCWASAPTTSIAAEMLSVGCLGLMSAEYVFPTHSELRSLLANLTNEPLPARLPGRFVLRSGPISSSDIQKSEMHVHALLSELRPADHLKKRVEIIVENLGHTKVFAELIELHLFGVTVAVPNAVVKNTLGTQTFPVPTNVVVIEELQDLIG